MIKTIVTAIIVLTLPTICYVSRKQLKEVYDEWN